MVMVNARLHLKMCLFSMFLHLLMNVADLLQMYFFFQNWLFAFITTYERLHFTPTGALMTSYSKSIGINMELVPPLAAITGSILLGRLSTTFLSV